jgi:hypothetical protein
MRNPSKYNPTNIMYSEECIDLAKLIVYVNEVYNDYATIVNYIYDNKILSEHEFEIIESAKRDSKLDPIILMRLARIVVDNFDEEDYKIEVNRNFLTSIFSRLNSILKIYVKADSMLCDIISKQHKLIEGLYSKYRDFWIAIESRRFEIYKKLYNEYSSKFVNFHEKLPRILTLDNNSCISEKKEFLPQML